jgi:tetratricopeptide (TPR) repeat protein
LARHERLSTARYRVWSHVSSFHSREILSTRGVEVSTALLVELFSELPQLQPDDNPVEWRIRRQAANETFKKRVGERYLEGTLLRLLDSTDELTRRASLQALALLGEMKTANARMARCLQDRDPEVRQAAADALWTLWFRGDSEANNKDLKKCSQMRDRDKAMAGLNQLIERAGNFAEAYNQRAILSFRMKQYQQSLADCEKVLKLNPFHFGALAGMGQCYLHLRKQRAALKAFKQALRIHPYLDGVAETIRNLENSLDEERRDDKK